MKVYLHSNFFLLHHLNFEIASQLENLFNHVDVAQFEMHVFIEWDR
jgi:hypothetical protein